MTFLTEIPQYEPVARPVGALQIKHVIANPRGHELHFEGDRFAPHLMDEVWFSMFEPAVGDWAIYRGNGGVYIVSDEVFQRDYQRITGQPSAEGRARS